MKKVAPVDGLKKTKIVGTYKPQAWRWFNAKPLGSKSIVKVTDEENKF